MNWTLTEETRYKYIHVRSNAAPTTMEGGSVDFAGAKIYHAVFGLRCQHPIHASKS